MVNRNALSYWFPKIAAAGVPVPRTALVQMPRAIWERYLASFDGAEPTDGPDPQSFFDEIAVAGHRLGWPCFLRTDHTSHKHGWRETCFLGGPTDIPRHVWNLIEFSEMVSFGVVDLSWDRWAVREMLPTIHHGSCPGYGNMPITREFRFFVADGRVQCWHPYWPAEALEAGGAVFKDGFSVETLNHLDQEELDHITSIVEAAGAAVGGAWSIDVLQAHLGGHDWFVTDMALAEDSFHWPGCPNTNALSAPSPQASGKEAAVG